LQVLLIAAFFYTNLEGICIIVGECGTIAL
jgi:hypothetical protein